MKSAPKQLSIFNFVQESPQEPKVFVPIDRVGSTTQTTEKRKRGRPRKYDKEAIKAAQKDQGILVEKLDIKESDEDDESAANRKKIKEYTLLTYKKKLEILNRFISFTADRPLINGKPQSFDDFYRSIASELNVNWSTVKTLCLNYEKNEKLYLQLELITSQSGMLKERGHIIARTRRLSYGLELDEELADWLYGSIDLGYIITKELIREKAQELICPQHPNFKASDSWMDCFLRRHYFSLRQLNDKSPKQLQALEEIATKLKTATREVIRKYRIKPSRIINMDESPYFWEYLPRKVIAPTLSKSATGWKRGFHNSRSTLMLGIAANGDVLRPTLLLKQKSPYFLKADNDIGMYIMTSENGWAKENNIILWLKNVLLPHVKKDHTMLIWDSYEAHSSEAVLKFLKEHDNIHISTIVGGRTSVDQPLDINFNKKFKTICKKESIRHNNALLQYLHEANVFAEKTQQMSKDILQINKQVIIARKDKERRTQQRQTSVANYMTKITVEDIFSWIRKAFLEMRDERPLIQRGFRRSGFVVDDEMENLVEDDDSSLDNSLDAIPLDEDMDDQEGRHEDRMVPEESKEEDSFVTNNRDLPVKASNDFDLEYENPNYVQRLFNESLNNAFIDNACSFSYQGSNILNQSASQNNLSSWNNFSFSSSLFKLN